MKQFAAAFIIAIAMFISGCTGALPQPGSSEAQPIDVRETTASDAYVAPKLQALPAAANKWTLSGRDHAMDVAANSKAAVLADEAGNVYHLNMVNGTLTKKFQMTGFVPGHIYFVGNDKYAFFVRENGNSRLQITSTTGQMLWQQSVQGTPAVVASDDGERILLLEHAQGKARLFDAKGTLLASRSISPTASAQFHGRNVLLRNGREIAYFNQNGDVQFSYNVSTGPAPDYVVPGQTGNHFAITTKEGDPSLYLFDQHANLLWNSRLLAGQNVPVFSPTGDHLVVVNKGRRLEFQYFQLTGPHLLWRTALALRENGYATGVVESVSFTDTGALRVYYRDNHAEAYVIDFNRAGQIEQAVPIDAGRKVFGNEQAIFTLAPNGTLVHYKLSMRESQGVNPTPQMQIGRR